MKTSAKKRAYQRAYQAKKRAEQTEEQKEATRAYNRAWRAQNKAREEMAFQRFKANNNIDEMREIVESRDALRTYNREAKAKSRAKQKEAEKREEKLAKLRAYYHNNKEKVLSQQKNYRKENAEKKKAVDKNYLENLDLTNETICDEKRLLAWGVQVRKRDENRCYYNSEECSKTIDAHHIIPKEWKSFDKLRFSLDNGRCLCRKHHKEAHKEIAKWMRE